MRAHTQAQVLTDQSQQRENETRQTLALVTEQLKEHQERDKEREKQLSEQQQQVKTLHAERDALQQSQADSAKALQDKAEQVAALEAEAAVLRDEAQRRGEGVQQVAEMEAQLLEVRRERNKLRSGMLVWEAGWKEEAFCNGGGVKGGE